MKARYLFPKDYMADPSANVFNGRLYVYPSHDWDSGESFDDDGGHFQRRAYHHRRAGPLSQQTKRIRRLPICRKQCRQPRSRQDACRDHAAANGRAGAISRS